MGIKKKHLQAAAEDLHSIQGMCMSYGNDSREDLEILRKRIHAFALESLERLYDASGVQAKNMSFGRKPTGHPRAPFSTIGTKEWRVFMVAPDWLHDDRKADEIIKASSREVAKEVAMQRHPELVVYDVAERRQK